MKSLKKKKKKKNGFMVIERKREEFVDRTGDTIGIENGSWTILKLWKIGITTYASKFQGIQALELFNLPW